jgi:hypothetical protein
MIVYREQAEIVMKRHPDYSDVQVEIHDKTEELYDAATSECDVSRSPARAELFNKLYVVQARAYVRLVDNMEYQAAYELILRDNVREVWAQFAKRDKRMYDTIATLDKEFMQGMRLLVQHWITEGHRRIAETRKKASSGTAAAQQSDSNTDTRLDSAKTPEEVRVERNKLAEEYFAGFPEKIMVLDLCWAADEHYREWKRWLQNNSPIKNGSKPDLAFRAILKSGKRPIEYRHEERPSNWQ